MKNTVKISLILWIFTFIASVYSQPVVTVKNVTIYGNKEVKTKSLAPIIRLNKRSWFTQPEFDRRILKLDAITIKNYYLSKGFLSITVTDSFVVEEQQADIFFHVQEGKQYFIRSIKVFGNSLIPTQRVLDILQFQTGEPYNPVVANQQLPILEAEHHHYGKLYAKVEILDSVTDSVDISVTIREGIDVGIKNYFIEGIGSFDPVVVDREVAFKSGELYQKALIDKTQKHLKETGVFSLVTLSPVRLAQTDSLVNILIEVRQFKTREWISEGGWYPVQFFEGVDPISGVGGDIEWKNRSLFQTTTNFSTKLSGHIPFEQDFYYPKIAFDMTFANQWLFGFWRIPTSVGLYYESLKKPDRRNDPNIHRYGFKIENNVKFLNRSFVLTGIRWEKYIVPKETTENQQNATDIEQRSIDVNMHLDRSNDPLYPTRGYKLDVDLRQTGGPLLGGNREYFKYDVGLNSYLPIIGKLHFANRIKYGMMFGWKSGYDDIQFDKFYLGGSTTLRGWDTFRFQTEVRNGEVLPSGEIIRLLTNWELRFPLFWKIGCEVFYDGGLLTGNSSSISFRGIQWNQGVGLTLTTPLGPIRLDVAAPIENRDNLQVHLGIHYIF